MGLLATPGVEHVELSWEQVGGATRYHVYVARNPGVTEDSSEIADIAATTYIHTYLDPALTYHYRVSAENPWAEGPLSGEVNATPLPPPPEEAPGSVAATPGDTQVEVTWTSVADADGYHLYWDTTAGASANAVDDAESPYVHAGLDNGTSYYYRVSAYNAGGEGPLSAEVSAVPQVPAPGAPRNLRAVAGDGKVTLTWTEPAASEASSYIVYWDTESPVDTNSPAVTSVPGSPYVHLGRANGTTYYYRVSAMNPGGESALSLEVSATPQPLAPATPGYLQAEMGVREVSLNWGSVPGIVTYEVFWDTQAGVTVSDNSLTGIGATDFVHTGLPNGTTFYYRVRARNGGGASSLSQEASAKPQFQVETQEQTTASDAEAGDLFGWSVAVSGDYLVVGAQRGDTDEVADAGAAYVYERTGANAWQQVKKLVAADAAPGDRFGQSVAISGNHMVVGADGKGSDVGAAYVFERTAGAGGQWQEVSKLTATDNQAGDGFGYSVSISGDFLVVGAPWEDHGFFADDAGAAYMFERTDGNGWQQASKLTATGDQADDRFGHSVSISGDFLLVGAVGDDSSGDLAGAAYVFERTVGAGDEWQQVSKLTANGGHAGDGFGYSVSVSGDLLLVGAVLEDSAAYNGGAAYVFARTAGGEWQQAKKLVADDAKSWGQYGSSVAIDGDQLVVGARTGSAYLFERTAGADGGWQEILELTAIDAQAGDGFGYPVSIADSYLAAGAWATNDNAGACYVF